jgi:hypothetical protein
MPTLGRIQPPVRWVQRVLSKVVKRPELEVDHALPSRTEVKNAWGFISVSLMGHRCVVFGYKDNFASACCNEYYYCTRI